jgi:hypothetical protein
MCFIKYINILFTIPTIGVIGNGLTITFGDEYNVSDYRSYVFYHTVTAINETCFVTVFGVSENETTHLVVSHVSGTVITSGNEQYVTDWDGDHHESHINDTRFLFSYHNNNNEFLSLCEVNGLQVDFLSTNTLAYGLDNTFVTVFNSTKFLFGWERNYTTPIDYNVSYKIGTISEGIITLHTEYVLREGNVEDSATDLHLHVLNSTHLLLQYTSRVKASQFPLRYWFNGTCRIGVVMQDVTLIFRTNASGTWEIYGYVNGIIENGTYCFFNPDFNEYNVTYYWNASVLNYSETYHFTSWFGHLLINIQDNLPLGLILGVFITSPFFLIFIQRRRKKRLIF